jgi:hypothetical protein
VEVEKHGKVGASAPFTAKPVAKLNGRVAQAIAETSFSFYFEFLWFVAGHCFRKIQSLLCGSCCLPIVKSIFGDLARVIGCACAELKVSDQNRSSPTFGRDRKKKNTARAAKKLVTNSASHRINILYDDLCRIRE